MPASKFTLSKDLGPGHFSGSIEIDVPERIAEPGDIYVVKKPFLTAGGTRQYGVGRLLKIISRTDASPHGYKSSLGNCIVEDDFLTSIWSSIDMSIQEGTIELVYSK